MRLSTHSVEDLESDAIALLQGSLGIFMDLEADKRPWNVELVDLGRQGDRIVRVRKLLGRKSDPDQPHQPVHSSALELVSDLELGRLCRVQHAFENRRGIASSTPPVVSEREPERGELAAILPVPERINSAQRLWPAEWKDRLRSEGERLALHMIHEIFTDVRTA